MLCIDLHKEVYIRGRQMKSIENDLKCIELLHFNVETWDRNRKGFFSAFISLLTKFDLKETFFVVFANLHDT